jgi:acyl-CoA reductase-like NAD-dependent aldehyde dehydrogenase
MFSRNISKRLFSASLFPSKYPTQLFINNKWVNSVSGETFATINPSTEQEICQVSKAGKQDIDIAVAAAKQAFYHGEWSQYGPS